MTDKSSKQYIPRERAKVVAWVSISAMVMTIIGTATVDVPQSIVAGVISALVWGLIAVGAGVRYYRLKG